MSNLVCEDKCLDRGWIIGFIAGRIWGQDAYYFLDQLRDNTLIEILLDIREGKDREVKNE